MDYEEKKNKLEKEINNINKEMREILKNNIITIRSGISYFNNKIQIENIKNEIFTTLSKHLENLENITQHEVNKNIKNTLKMKEKFNKNLLNSLFVYKKFRNYIYNKIKDFNFENEIIHSQIPDNDQNINLFINLVDNSISFFQNHNFLYNFKGIHVEKDEIISSLFKKDFIFYINAEELSSFSLSMRIKKILEFINNQKDIEFYTRVMNLNDQRNVKEGEETSEYNRKQNNLLNVFQKDENINNILNIKYYPLITQSFEETDEIKNFIKDSDNIFAINYLLMMAPNISINLDKFKNTDDYYFIKWREYKNNES